MGMNGILKSIFTFTIIYRIIFFIFSSPIHNNGTFINTLKDSVIHSEHFDNDSISDKFTNLIYGHGNEISRQKRKRFDLPTLQECEHVRQMQKETMKYREISQEPSVGHRGVSGLGHNLVRLGAAHHLVKGLNLTRNGLYISWGTKCGGKKEDGTDLDIIEYLLGGNVIPVPSLGPNDSPIIPFYRTNNTKKKGTKDSIYFINQVDGYRAVWKRHIDRILKMLETKVKSDFEMYSSLRALFRKNDQARQFVEKQKFDQHFVLGLHVRAGNGETGDFLDKERAFNIEDWTKNFAKLMMDFVESDMYHQWSDGLSPILFVASDTPKVIDILKTTIGDSKSKLKVVSYEQTYLENSIALFAKFNNSESCYQSESDQFMDQTLLSGANVVIAGQWSSFTQSMPITMMLGHKDPKENKRFCEVGLNGDQIRCTRDYGEWMKRWNTPNETESTIERFGKIVYDEFKYANHQQWPIELGASTLKKILKDSGLEDNIICKNFQIRGKTICGTPENDLGYGYV